MIVEQPHWREKRHIGHEKLKEKDAAEKVGGQMVAAVSIPGLLALHETKWYDTIWCHEKTT